MEDWTLENELNAEDFDDDDDFLVWVHDQDSDRPMEIADEEPERDEDDQSVIDLLLDTIDKLEEESEKCRKTVVLPKSTIDNALQFLKAYIFNFKVCADDYYYDYDE